MNSTRISLLGLLAMAAVAVAGDPNEAGLPQQPTHDIQIINSRFANGNGIVVGGEAANGVYNVIVKNITANRTAHVLELKADRTRSNQAAGDYNIWAENTTLTDVRQPLMISAYDPTGDAPPGPPAEPPYDPPKPVTPATANIHDVTIQDMTATGATQPSLIVGLPEACVRNVALNNVHITSSSPAFQLRNMTGRFTNVTATLPAGEPPFVVQENVTVTTAGTTPPIANTPPETLTTPPEQPCS